MAVLYYRNSKGNLVPLSFGTGDNYELPVASTNTLGGVKVDGSTITISENGIISCANAGDSFSKLEYATDDDIVTLWK